MQADNNLAAQRYQQLGELPAGIAGSLQGEVERIGFDLSELKLHPLEAAVYRLERDPFNGEESLVGEWRDDRGIKFGHLVFHADGSFFVEQDVARPHPKKPGWFVEAVNAWGSLGHVKAEARLLPMPA